MHRTAITKIAAKTSTEKPVIQRINQLLFLIFVINPIYFIQKMFDTIRIIRVMYFHFGTKRTDRSLQTKTEIKVLSQEVERHIIEIIYLHLPQQVTQNFRSFTGTLSFHGSTRSKPHQVNISGRNLSKNLFAKSVQPFFW